MTGRCRILVNAVVRASAPLPVACWGAGRHPKGRNVVEQPRTARLDAAVGGAAPHGDVIHHVPALTFHSRSSRGDPPRRALRPRNAADSDTTAAETPPRTRYQPPLSELRSYEPDRNLGSTHSA